MECLLLCTAAKPLRCIATVQRGQYGPTYCSQQDSSQLTMSSVRDHRNTHVRPPSHRHAASVQCLNVSNDKICLARCAINLSSDGPSIRVWHKYHPLDDGCICPSQTQKPPLPVIERAARYVASYCHASAAPVGHSDAVLRHIWHYRAAAHVRRVHRCTARSSRGTPIRIEGQSAR